MRIKHRIHILKLVLLTFSFSLNFTLASAQGITGINPDEGNAGGTLNVTITGANTHFAQASNTVSFYFFGATTTATWPNSLNVLNNQALMANITIPPGTPTGTYSFSVSNYIDGYLFSLNSFKVLTPFINSIVPSEGAEGTTLNVTITGINTSFTMATNTTVRFYFSGSTPTATYPNNVTIQNDQTLTANLSIPAGISEGWYDFSVSNTLDGYMLKTNGFKVKAGSFSENIFLSRQFTIYPNPFNESFLINITNLRKESAVIRLYNSAGRLIDRREVILSPGDNSILYDSDLSQGIYFLMLESEDGSTTTRKIIRN